MIKLGLIYGGVSTEHDVSITSFKSIISNLDKEKYDIYEIYISKDNIWYETKNEQVNKINNIIEYLKNLDVVFPVLHGMNGEDGTLQGMLELFNIPYVGCGILSSSICMDKVYTKLILDKFKINQVKYMFLKKTDKDFIYVDDDFNEKVIELNNFSDEIISNLKLPIFVKPSKGGSSVGINKAKTKEELIRYIEYASKFDNKILLESSHDVLEIECAIINGKASTPGMIIPNDEFYSYDEKYKNNKTKIKIPADISDEDKTKIKDIAKKVFKILDCKDLARIDFFIDKQTGEIYVNEINTLPGFTNISMYPKLLEYDGLAYNKLLDYLILNNKLID